MTIVFSQKNKLAFFLVKGTVLVILVIGGDCIEVFFWLPTLFQIVYIINFLFSIKKVELLPLTGLLQPSKKITKA